MVRKCNGQLSQMFLVSLYIHLHWVYSTIVYQRVADVNLCSIDPFCTTISSVCDGNGGDDVRLQQVHSPPRIGLLNCVGAWSGYRVRVTVSINSTVGGSSKMPCPVGLGCFSTQGHIFYEWCEIHITLFPLYIFNLLNQYNNWSFGLL